VGGISNMIGYMRNIEGRGNLENIVADGKIILELTLRKCVA
jgi:hypothetical protein